LGAGSVDQEESIQQDQSVIKEPSQPAAREQQQVVALASNAGEAYKEQDRYVETFGIWTSGISELRHR